MSSKPVCLFLRPKDNVYAIDTDPGNIPVPKNKILMDLVLNITSLNDPVQGLHLLPIRVNRSNVCLQPSLRNMSVSFSDKANLRANFLGQKRITISR